MFMSELNIPNVVGLQNCFYAKQEKKTREIWWHYVIRNGTDGNSNKHDAKRERQRNNFRL